MNSSLEPSNMLGASVRGRRVDFRVWAPSCQEVTVRIEGGPELDLRPGPEGMFTGSAHAKAGDTYFLVPRSSGNPRELAVPDPVSRSLPAGPHGPTEILDPRAFVWSDQGWPGIPLAEYILYELHTGTFTREGTFEGVVRTLAHLCTLGVTVIELMPVAAFPGVRNWGYDGASPYAVQGSYGGPDGLKRLVDAAHRLGLAVVLDVVYNHLGPEGNYLRLFGPYFDDRARTPWGDGINFDGAGSSHVRRHFVENALYWVREYHLDGLRLDAVQTMRDRSPLHIVGEIAAAVHGLGEHLGRTVCVMAETDENDVRYVQPREQGGLGLDALWSDDAHHSLHASLTGERHGYYRDFGEPAQIVRALEDGFVFQGEHSMHAGRPRGRPAGGVPLPAHIMCLQNHDQVGNRAMGERLSELVPRGAARMATALLLLSPATPLLFMGEEIGESSPFQFFTDFTDATISRAVTEGRRAELASPSAPDPQGVETFERSRLRWDPPHDNETLGWYRALLQIRKRYVTPNERTARARALPHAVVMDIPRVDPLMMVIAEWPGSVGVAGPVAWQRILGHDEDGFRVSVFVRSMTGTQERAS